jgi:hypothetical protein
MSQTVSTASNSTGDTFQATLEEPVSVGGQVVAPQGAVVEGRVVEADKGGRVSGVARLAVTLSRLNAPGGGADLATDTITQQAGTTKGKDATKIAIGSGIGAAIGAIAGGGKGAATGAAAGGAAGTGVVLATRGDAAEIPSEAILTFTVNTPVTLNISR